MAERKLAAEDFIFKGHICSKVHKYPEGLEILNEVCTFLCILDYSVFDTPRKLWANAPWLEFTGETLEQYQSYDFAGNMSHAVKEKCHFLGKHIQQERNISQFEWTIFPKDAPVQVLLVMRPIQFEGMDLPLILCHYLPPPIPSEELTQRDQFGLSILQLLQNPMLMFDRCQEVEESKCVWANISAKFVYDCDNEKLADPKVTKTEEGEDMCLKTILDKVAWKGEAEKEDVLTKLQDIKIDSPPVFFSGQKTSAAEIHLGQWRQFKFSPCINPVSGSESFLLAETDVTQLMQARLKAEELEDSNELKDRFLQCVSHELRTPLHGILGLAGILGARHDCPAWIRKPLATMEDSAKRLSSVVDDILEMTQCSRHDVRLNCRDVSLRELAAAVCHELAPTVPGGVELSNQIEESARVQGDPARLHKVLRHLLQNALKFTQRGAVTVSARAEGRGVRVEVADSGCGIAAAQLDKIWEAFEQGDSSSTRNYGGLGLGLALAKSLVDAHSGTVEVESECRQDSGFTRVSFTLPERQAPEPAGDSFRIRPRSDDTQLRVGHVRRTASGQRAMEAVSKAELHENGAGTREGAERQAGHVTGAGETKAGADTSGGKTAEEEPEGAEHGKHATLAARGEGGAGACAANHEADSAVTAEREAKQQTTNSNSNGEGERGSGTMRDGGQPVCRFCAKSCEQLRQALRLLTAARARSARDRWRLAAMQPHPHAARVHPEPGRGRDRRQEAGSEAEEIVRSCDARVAAGRDSGSSVDRAPGISCSGHDPKPR